MRGIDAHNEGSFAAFQPNGRRWRLLRWFSRRRLCRCKGVFAQRLDARGPPAECELSKYDGNVQKLASIIGGYAHLYSRCWVRWLGLWNMRAQPAGSDSAPTEVTASAADAMNPRRTDGHQYLCAHNLRLHQGPDFRVYIQWLRGHLTAYPPRRHTASFDDPESFYLNVTEWRYARESG